MQNLLRILLPHYFFKEPIPQITNPKLIQAIQYVRKARTTDVAIERALDILATRYKSHRFETYVLFPMMYQKDPNTLWRRKGFMHCTQQNFLFRVLMVKSGKLKESDIHLGHSLVWEISPHQFLKVKLKNKTIAIDPWNYALGARIGEYATGFGMKRL